MPDRHAHPFVIRSFRRSDQAACQKLYVEGLAGGKLSENDTGLDLDDIDHTYMKSPGNHFWVAEAADAGAVGMIGVQHYDADVGEIRRLRVASTHRRQGIGSGLMTTALKFCADNHYLKITLDTFMEREPAIRLFEKFHFRHSRTRNVSGKDLLYFYLDLYSRDTPEPPHSHHPGV